MSKWYANGPFFSDRSLAMVLLPLPWALIHSDHAKFPCALPTYLLYREAYRFNTDPLNGQIDSRY